LPAFRILLSFAERITDRIDQKSIAALLHREARYAKHMRQKIPSPGQYRPPGRANKTIPGKAQNSLGLMTYAFSESVAPSSRSSNGSIIIDIAVLF